MIYLYVYIAGMVWFTLLTLLAGAIAGYKSSKLWALTLSLAWPIFMSALCVSAIRDGIREHRKELMSKGRYL